MLLTTLNLALTTPNVPDLDNASVGNGLWSLTNIGSTPTANRFN